MPITTLCIVWGAARTPPPPKKIYHRFSTRSSSASGSAGGKKVEVVLSWETTTPLIGGVIFNGVFSSRFSKLATSLTSDLFTLFEYPPISDICLSDAIADCQCSECIADWYTFFNSFNTHDSVMPSAVRKFSRCSSTHLRISTRRSNLDPDFSGWEYPANCADSVMFFPDAWAIQNLVCWN